jgi:hypothetical protein
MYYMHVCICECVRVYTCICVRLYLSVCKHVKLYIPTHTYAKTHTYIRTDEASRGQHEEEICRFLGDLDTLEREWELDRIQGEDVLAWFTANLAHVSGRGMVFVFFAPSIYMFWTCWRIFDTCLHAYDSPKCITQTPIHRPHHRTRAPRSQAIRPMHAPGHRCTSATAP